MDNTEIFLFRFTRVIVKVDYTSQLYNEVLEVNGTVIKINKE